MITLLKNCNIIDALENYSGKHDILIEGSRIVKIAKEINEDADKVWDISGMILVPGFIDMHCHLRQPGFEHKETIKTGSEAAAKGGFTTICCMPNTKPIIDNIYALKDLQNIIKRDSIIEVIPIAAVTIGQEGRELVSFKEMIANGVRLFSDDGNPIWNDDIMKESLTASKENDILIIDHCEDLSLVSGGVINKGNVSRKFGFKGISNVSESLPVIRNIQLAEKLDASIHIAHISTFESLEAIKEAKEKGIKVSCEVTPHHISLCDEDIIKDNTDFKVNPPLRGIKDVKALQEGLKDSIIDVIATDHAPHSDSDKPKDFYKAANGISGIELAFSICFTYLVRTGLLTIKELIKLMCLNPANILKIDKGRICVGAVADLAVIDLYKEFTVNKEEMVSKGKNTPFNGKKLWGQVLATISNGNIVYMRKGGL